jgi:predicted phage terminase large subunit-like protein
MTVMVKDMELYILEYSVGRYNPAELQDKIIYHHRKRRPEKIGIEAFQAQTIIGFNLKAEMQRQGMYANIEEIRQNGDKESKLRKLIPLYRNGHIWHRNNMEELEHELLRFPRGRHDDVIDALQMAYSMYEISPNTKSFS